MIPGQQNNNFNPNMNLPKNNDNNQIQMPNQNMQNNNNMNIQVLNFGFLNNNGNISINTIQNICAKNLEGNNAQKAISSSLKSQYDGEWIVLVVNSNDNFEFNISDFPINNAVVLQSGPKNIYICKYV
jgi:protein involved in polysaccharide export with SLBB domain